MRAVRRFFGYSRAVAFWALTGLITATPLLAVQSAHAIGGGGMPLDPYLITSCADFKDISNDLNAFYKLVNDIDCTSDGNSIAIGSDSDPFTGTLIGNYKKITVAINSTSWPEISAGLFNNMFIATVQNLTIAGSVSTDVASGALAGNADFTSINNVSVQADVTGNGKTGGLIGSSSNLSVADIDVTGDVTGQNFTGGVFGYSAANVIMDISYSGDVTAPLGTYVGGIGGYIEDTVVVRAASSGTVSGQHSVGGLFGGAGSSYPVTTSLSYTTSDVTATINAAGGLVGELSGLYELEDSYARGAVIGDDMVGGIAGSSTANTIRRVYATGDITALSGTEIGGILGLELVPSTTITDSVWDVKGGDNPLLTAGTTLTGITGNHSSNQMKTVQLYTTNVILNAPWDFDTIWGMNAQDNDGFPFLAWQSFHSDPPRDNDDIPSSVEDSAPNNGDSNNDGKPDAEQNEVISITSSVTGKNITIAMQTGWGCDFVKFLSNDTGASSGSDTAFPVKDSGYTYPGGFLYFTTECAAYPVTTGVSIYYYDLADAPLVPRKYNRNTHAYSTIPGATITSQTIGGKKVYVVSYNIADGGPLDEDGIEDGIIVDPIGLGIQNVSVPNTGTPGILAFLSAQKKL